MPVNPNLQFQRIRPIEFTRGPGVVQPRNIQAADNPFTAFAGGLMKGEEEKSKAKEKLEREEAEREFLREMQQDRQEAATEAAELKSERSKEDFKYKADYKFELGEKISKRRSSGRGSGSSYKTPAIPLTTSTISGDTDIMTKVLNQYKVPEKVKESPSLLDQAGKFIGGLMSPTQQVPQQPKKTVFREGTGFSEFMRNGKIPEDMVKKAIRMTKKAKNRTANNRLNRFDEVLELTSNLSEIYEEKIDKIQANEKRMKSDNKKREVKDKDKAEQRVYDEGKKIETEERGVETHVLKKNLDRDIEIIEQSETRAGKAAKMVSKDLKSLAVFIANENKALNPRQVAELTTIKNKINKPELLIETLEKTGRTATRENLQILANDLYKRKKQLEAISDDSKKNQAPIPLVDKHGKSVLDF